MANIVGDIAIKVGADISQLTTAMGKASGDVKKLGSEADGLGPKMAKMGAAAAAAFGVISGAAIAVGGAAKFVADTSREIERLAMISGTGIERFQALSFAARDYGINQEQLADILKDVNDKIGDFMQTGAGPMADFFTNIAPKVGVTVDQFKRLSAPDALGLYVSSLERAGVSHKEMTFYMEAMASDATALTPLFLNNASALRELESAAKDMGYVIDADLIQKSARMGEIWDRLMGQMQARFIWFAATVMEGFDQIFGITSQAQIGQLTSTLNDLTDEQIRLGEEISTYKGRGWTALVEDSETRLGAVRDEMAATAAEIQKLQLVEQRAAEAKARLNEMTTTGGAGGAPAPATVGGGGGGASSGPTDADLEALRSSFASEAAVIAEEYEKRQLMLDEFLAAKKIKEDEYASLSLAAQQDFNNKVVALEQTKKQAMLQGLGGMFGDLSSLMSSSNKKLFAIGKAAAIAEATVSGYQAATDAWQKGMKIGGPPVAAAFTAASLAKTGALIAGIAKQNVGGAGGGAVSAGGGGATSAPAAQAPGQTLNFTISNDPFGFGERIVRQIATQLNEASRNGSTLRATVN